VVPFFLLWIKFLLQETTLLLAETPSFFLLLDQVPAEGDENFG
jgi:hypothetical protein